MSVFSYAGTGNITPRRFVFLGESISYSYVPGIEDIFIHLDLGPSLLSAPTVIIDHGSVTQQESYTREDWGYIRYEQSRYAFGDIKLASSTTFKVKKHYVGSGQIFEFGKSYTRLVAPWIVSGTVRVSGIGQSKFVPNYNANGIVRFRTSTNISRTVQHFGAGKIFSTSLSSTTQARAFKTSGLFNVYGASELAQTRSYLGEGTLPTLSLTQTNKVFSYVGSGSILSLSTKVERRVYSYNGSSVFDFNYLDYGSVSQSASSFIQHADLDVITNVHEDWGLIRDTFTRYPFGSKRISGESLYSFKPTWVGSGVIKLSGVAFIKQKPIWISYSEILVSGSAKPNFSLLHPGSGSLFSIGGGEQRRSYGYEGSGKLFTRISSVELNTESYVGSGIVKSSGSATIAFTPNWISRGSTSISGAAIDVRTSYSESGFGRLFNLVSKEERRTYSYNTSSIEFFDYLDYGLVSEIHTSSWDNGLVSEPNSGRTDWGYIRDTISNYPFGALNLVSLTRPNFSIGHTTSGYLPLFGGAAEATSTPAKVQESTLNITGVVYSTITNSYSGQGLLFNIESAETRKLRHYNGSGSIFAINGAAEAFGANPLEDPVPIRVIGYANTSFTPNWNSFGTIRIESEAAYIVTSNTYSGFGRLFEISNKEERRTYSYNTSSIVEYTHLDYGSVSNNHANSYDYEGILQIPSITDDYEYIIPNITRYPFGDFNIFGISKTNFSLLQVGSGIIGPLSGEVKIRFPPFHSGEGVLFGFGGAAESVLFNPPDITTDIKLSGSAAEVTGFTPPSSTLEIKISGEGYETILNAAERFINIDIFGSAAERRTESYAGSGSIFAFAGAAEAFGANPPDITTDIKISGIGGESTSTFVPIEGGVLFGFGGAVESSTVSEVEVANIIISGSAITNRIPNFNGSGVIRSLSGAAVTRAFSPDEEQILLNFNGFASQKFVSANVGDASLNIFGEISTPIRTFAEQPTARIFVSGAGSEKFLPNWNGSGTIFAFAGAAEAFVINPPDQTTDLKFFGFGRQSFSYANYNGSVEFKLSGEVEIPILTYAEQPTIQISISGTGIERNTESYYGSGLFSVFSGAAESVGYNPRDITTDIKLSGDLVESVGFREIGSGIIHNISGSSSPEILTFAEQPRIEIDITGIGKTNFSLRHIGSGSIFSIGGAAEAISVNPPDITTDIQISGSRESEKISRSEVGDVSTRIYGNAFKTRYIPNFNGSGTIYVDTTTTYSETDVYDGFGSIFSVGGAAESFTVNPDEEQVLFSFSGKAQERVSITKVEQVEIDISGEVSNVYLVRFERGDGFIRTSGVGKTNFSLRHIGSGVITNLSGAAESVAYNPSEEQLLFSISGSATERNTEAYRGEGILYSASGSAESTAVVPETQVSTSEAQNLFRFIGNDVDSKSKSYSGKGNLFSIGNSIDRERFAYETTGTISVGGFASYAEIKAYEGIGSISTFSGAAEVSSTAESFTVDIKLTGSARTSVITPYNGSGVVFAIGGSAESATINYQTDTLFKISGFTRTAKSKSHDGEIDINLQGSAGVSFTRIPYVGSGNINFYGLAQLKESNVYFGSGSIRKRSKAEEPTVGLSHVGSGTVRISGESRSVISVGYNGSGRIFEFGKAQETSPASKYSGFGVLVVTGQSINRKVHASPQRAYGWIV